MRNITEIVEAGVNVTKNEIKEISMLYYNWKNIKENITARFPIKDSELQKAYNIVKDWGGNSEELFDANFISENWDIDKYMGLIPEVSNICDFSFKNFNENEYKAKIKNIIKETYNIKENNKEIELYKEIYPVYKNINPEWYDRKIKDYGENIVKKAVEIKGSELLNRTDFESIIKKIKNEEDNKPICSYEKYYYALQKLVDIWHSEVKLEDYIDGKYNKYKIYNQFALNMKIYLKTILPKISKEKYLKKVGNGKIGKDVIALNQYLILLILS